MREWARVSTDAQRGQKRSADPKELEIQEIVSCSV